MPSVVLLNVVYAACRIILRSVVKLSVVAFRVTAPPLHRRAVKYADDILRGKVLVVGGPHNEWQT